MRIRPLTATDLPAALELSSVAGWNQTAADWQMLLDLDPAGCFGMECDSRLVATTTLIAHDVQLAWLGMVLTDPRYRLRGIARQLVESALRLAQSRAIPTVKLDATEQGQSLYQSLGFRVEQAIERWSRTGFARPRSSEPAHPLSTAAIAELDRSAFGADRSAALNLLAARSQTIHGPDGFIMSRPGSRAAYLGPFISRTPAHAEELLRAALDTGEPRWFWDLFPANPPALALADRMGFQPERKLVRMVLGPALSGDHSQIYGAAGFELG